MMVGVTNTEEKSRNRITAHSEHGKVGEVGMKKRKPKRCSECRCFNSAIYGMCMVKGTWFGVEDGAWIHEKRPNWCPLDEKGDVIDDKNVNRNSLF